MEAKGPPLARQSSLRGCPWCSLLRLPPGLRRGLPPAQLLVVFPCLFALWSGTLWSPLSQRSYIPALEVSPLSMGATTSTEWLKSRFL